MQRTPQREKAGLDSASSWSHFMALASEVHLQERCGHKRRGILRSLPFVGFAGPPPPDFCLPEGAEGRYLPHECTDATYTQLGLSFEGTSSQRTTEALSQLLYLYAGHSPAPGFINKSREVILSRETGMSLELQSCSVSCLCGSRVRCYSVMRNRAWIEPSPRLQLSIKAQAEGVAQGAETQTEMP